jgi:hypothetical protein
MLAPSFGVAKREIQRARSAHRCYHPHAFEEAKDLIKDAGLREVGSPIAPVV